MAHITIATPSLGTVKTGYVGTLLRTIRDLEANGATWSYSSFDAGPTLHQRNLLASRFISRPEGTHLFFIDSDMEFDGTLCRRLLSFDKPVIGAVYVSRERNAPAPKWHVDFGEASTRATNGAARCLSIGFGAVLIRRDVLETMVSRGVVKRQSTDGEPVYNFFSVRAEDAADGAAWGEDISFCRRWRIDCGGEIWALLDARIGHIGDYAYGADESFLEAMQRQGKVSPRA